VVIDSARLNTIDVHADDLFAVVGAGVSWQQLADALAPLGLRSLVPGPISGAVTTVGGAVSQYVPGSMDGVLGVRAVLSDGTVVTTGSAARQGTAGFHRHAGPDLTGLFIGDCGAFGVKTEIMLRLVRDQPAAFASFAYADPRAMIDDIIELKAAGVVARVLALDQSRGDDAGKLDAGEAWKTAGAVAASAGSALGALREVASMVRGKFELSSARWSLHLTAEGVTGQIAEQMIALARERCLRSGREIEPTVPKALRARPYSIRGFVGVEGERWIPVHGMLAFSKAKAAFNELEAILNSHAEAMKVAGVRHSWLLSSPGAYLTIEPMFFWNDALDIIHLRHLSERNRERFAGRPRNDNARHLVAQLRTELRDCFERHQAVHAQTGRFYRHTGRLDAGSRDLLNRVKHALDPGRQMNPGVLGLD
jgi:D-lactate dehydrogenase (cytochrome)